MNAVVMALVKVLLDYILIFGKFGMPEMGIKGAAIASAVSYTHLITCLVAETYLRSTAERLERSSHIQIQDLWGDVTICLLYTSSILKYRYGLRQYHRN